MALDFIEVNRLLQKMRRIRKMESRYEGVGPVFDESDFKLISFMNKQDFKTVLEEIREKPRPQKGYLFSSGGTLGSPQINLIPSHLFLDDIIKNWKPLDSEDVFCNLFLPGKMWSSHYFYNALGDRLAKETIPLGPINESELGVWIRFFNEQGVTAIAGTPTTLKQIIGYCHREGLRLTTVRKVLWVGEQFGNDLAELLGKVLPEVEVWGLYGSTETWVIGYNGPHCSFDCFHLLPYQYVEVLEEGELAVTGVHPDTISIALRYRLGDVGEWSSCLCGKESRTLRILGRKGREFKFRGALFDPAWLIDTAKDHSCVTQGQVVILKREAGSEILELRVVDPHGGVDIEELRDHVISQIFDLSNIVARDRESFRVSVVPNVQVNSRTHKTPMVVWEDKK
ncbi:AMP-binding protein [Desmospora profundinema]|uniref:Phenylacetate-CoA ligase n=1 Tax=Desmospora profundinema TaxID=1571184 RepID=A0ABU1IRN4_9BACL|nr:AMP-binding protein [Desmospora profundinema]MDR6226589.1 phenylacetate-CoA ligase [Desmospora profundinema]